MRSIFVTAQTRDGVIKPSISLITHCLATPVFLMSASLVGAVEIKVLSAEAFKQAFRISSRNLNAQVVIGLQWPMPLPV